MGFTSDSGAIWILVGALIGLAVCSAGFHFDAWRGEYPMRWLLAALGVYMMLIIVAMSRISMRIVNHAIEEAAANGIVGANVTPYRARPPRRNLAIFCVGLYTAVEFFLPATRLSGWLALAAAAALFNLLNDWHIGRVLFSRRPLMLYGVYLLMALGYALMGAALVFATGALAGGFGAGRHLLAIGGVGLGIFAVMSIAGRAHCGQPFEMRRWLPLAVGLLAAAALARALVAWPGAEIQMLWIAAGLLWIAAWGLFAWYMAPLFLAPRTDGLSGCKGTAIP